MTSLRKFLFVLLLVLLAAVCSAALADTDYLLSPAPGQITFLSNNANKDKTVVTAENLESHPELLTVIGMRKDDAIADFQARGVIMQIWSPIKKKYTCLEVSVIKDEDASQYFDLMTNPDDRTNWNTYMDSFWKNEKWAEEGYKFQKPEKKRCGSYYYLLSKYSRKSPAGNYNGYMARTVYRGYTLIFDFRAYNQSVLDTHANQIYNLFRTFLPSEAAAAAASAAAAESAPGDSPAPAEQSGDEAVTPEQKASSASITITQAPPVETNVNTFTVQGTTIPDAQVIGVLMRLGSDVPVNFSTNSSKKGAFKLNAVIPEAQEGYWLLTLNVLVDGNVVADTYFENINYKKTLLPVSFDTTVPESTAAGEMTVSGTTVKGVNVQCIVTSSTGFSWQGRPSTTNGTGRFTFTFPMKDEGIYDIVLSFSKKGLNSERRSFTVERILTDEARRVQIRKDAKKVGYSTLSAKLGQYVKQTIKYENVYITAMEQVGDQWMITAAVRKSGERYSDFLVYMADEEPSFSVEEQHTLYGLCTGSHQIQSEEGSESLPAFDLLLWD